MDGQAMPSEPLPEPELQRAEINVTAALGGRVRLRQPKVGYRAGMDAALLAAAIRLGPGERALEAGCGAGAALVQAALRNPEVRLVGIERDAIALALARENIALNGLAGRVEAMVADVAAPFRSLALEPFDAAFANPPFFDDATAIRGPHPARRGAYLAEDGLGAWIDFLLKGVREDGRITVIHRADRLADLLALIVANGGGSIRVRPVQPFADRPAKRVLVRAAKAGRAPLVLLPPLVLHDHAGGKHTPAADAILRGEAALGWD